MRGFKFRGLEGSGVADVQAGSGFPGLGLKV